MKLIILAATFLSITHFTTPLLADEPETEDLNYRWVVMECYAAAYRIDMELARFAGRSQPFQAGLAASQRTQARHEAVANAQQNCLLNYGRAYGVQCIPMNFGCKAIDL